MSEEQQKLDIDFEVCCPDENAKAEPYHALMFVDADGKTNGNLWGMNGSLMLFDNMLVAKQVREAINDPSIALRGITAKHLEELKKLEDSDAARLFVIVGLTVTGKVEAIPLAEHLESRSKAKTPPPMPPKA